MKIKIVLGLIYSLLLMSCSLFDLSNYRTENGQNAVVFKINKTRCYHASRGAFGNSKRIVSYRIDDEQDISVISLINNRQFPFIIISIPLEDVADYATLQPDIRLGYLYLPKITHDVLLREDEYGFKIFKTIVDRPAEYRLVNISESSLLVRRWDPEAHVFAGDFSFKGHYVDSTGKKRSIKVTEGYFDVTDKYQDDVIKYLRWEFDYEYRSRSTIW